MEPSGRRDNRRPGNAGSPGCYWERLAGFSGSDDRITNGLPDGDPAIVTIESTDAGFTSKNCGSWEPME